METKKEKCISCGELIPQDNCMYIPCAYLQNAKKEGWLCEDCAKSIKSDPDIQSFQILDKNDTFTMYVNGKWWWMTSDKNDLVNIEHISNELKKLILTENVNPFSNTSVELIYCDICTKFIHYYYRGTKENNYKNVYRNEEFEEMSNDEGNFNEVSIADETDGIDIPDEDIKGSNGFICRSCLNNYEPTN